MDIRVCFPSYKRPDRVKTWRYLPFAKAYVSPEEGPEYRKNYPDRVVVDCDPGVQGNVCRVRNHILDREFGSGADVVLIVDDDLRGVFQWSGNRAFKVRTGDFLAFVEHFSILAEEWGAKLWGISINKDKQIYREMVPFNTVFFVGAPFQCFLKGNECRYDERLFLKEDYDMTLQQIQRYRICLRVMRYFYDVQQSEQPGGCASQRNLAEEERQLLLLQKKWGKKIVRFDTNQHRSHNRVKVRKEIDYNPVIRVPIPGL